MSNFADPYFIETKCDKMLASTVLCQKPQKHNGTKTSITVKIETPDRKYGSGSDLTYEKIVAYDLGTETAITAFNGSDFDNAIT